MFGSGMVPSILLLVLLFTVPETARFLLSKGRRSEAERVAARIGPDALNEILFAEQQPEVRSRHTPRILVLGISLAVLQQVTGINVFLYYAPSIFAQVTRSTNVALLQTVILGADAFDPVLQNLRKAHELTLSLSQDSKPGPTAVFIVDGFKPEQVR